MGTLNQVQQGPAALRRGNYLVDLSLSLIRKTPLKLFMH
jgi:hypothetical protein